MRQNVNFPGYKEELRSKSFTMIKAFLDGFRIQAIGGTVYQFKTGHADSGKFLMTTSMAAEANTLLGSLGILMRRIDAGGSPEWTFSVDKSVIPAFNCRT